MTHKWYLMIDQDISLLYSQLFHEYILLLPTPSINEKIEAHGDKMTCQKEHRKAGREAKGTGYTQLTSSKLQASPTWPLLSQSPAISSCI